MRNDCQNSACHAIRRYDEVFSSAFGALVFMRHARASREEFRILSFWNFACPADSAAMPKQVEPVREQDATAKLAHVQRPPRASCSSSESIVIAGSCPQPVETASAVAVADPRRPAESDACEKHFEQIRS